MGSTVSAFCRRFAWLLVTVCAMCVNLRAQGCDFTFTEVPHQYLTPILVGLSESGQPVGWSYLAKSTDLIFHARGSFRSNGRWTWPAFDENANWGLSGAGPKAGQFTGFYNSGDWPSDIRNLLFQAFPFFAIVPDAVLPDDHGLLLNGSEVTVLEYPNSRGIRPIGWDSRGIIVGTVLLGSPASPRLFKLAVGESPEKAVFPFGTTPSTALAVTPAGRILARTSGPGAQSQTAVIDPYGAITLPSGIRGTATGMNDRGDIVSYSTDGNSYLLHDDTTYTIRGRAIAINNGGQILLDTSYPRGTGQYVVTSCRPPVPKSMAIAEGDQQIVSVGWSTSPLIVRVLDAAGYGARGVSVSFAVTAGTGTIYSTTIPSEADGTAATTYRATGRVGRVTVTASADGLPSSVS